MKILGICCSPRRNGNTEILVREALKGAEESGAETELVTLAGKNLKPCDGCLSCEATTRCHLNDDMQEIYEKLLAADGIIIGTPVYFWSVVAQAKILIDRAYAVRSPNLRLAGKAAGAIAVAGRAGAMEAITLLERVFLSHHMLVAESVEGLARDKGDMVKDKRGMRCAFELGKQVTFLARQTIRLPEEHNISFYKFVAERYNTPRYPVP